MKLQRAEEALVELLGKHDQAVSARIAAICIEMGPRTAPLLIRALREGTPKRASGPPDPGRDPGSARNPLAWDALTDKEDDGPLGLVWALG